MNTVDARTIRAGEYPQTVTVRTHTLSADVAAATGGTDSAPGPHDYFDAALATCKVATAMWYAKRHDIPLERVDAHVESDDSLERTGVYRMHVRLAFHGPLSDEQRASLARAVSACPIHKLMTTTEVQIDTVTA